jgi:hypothetical protein
MMLLTVCLKSLEYVNRFLPVISRYGKYKGAQGVRILVMTTLPPPFTCSQPGALFSLALPLHTSKWKQASLSPPHNLSPFHLTRQSPQINDGRHWDAVRGPGFRCRVQIPFPSDCRSRDEGEPGGGKQMAGGAARRHWPRWWARGVRLESFFRVVRDGASSGGGGLCRRQCTAGRRRWMRAVACGSPAGGASAGSCMGGGFGRRGL